MQTATIKWDFDGTLLPLAPYDSEQTLMMYKLTNDAARPPYAIRVVASLLIWSDRRQLLRKTFKKRRKYQHKDYRFISSISEIMEVLNLASV